MSGTALGLSLIVACAFIEALAQICWKLSSQCSERKIKTMWVALGGLAYAFEIPLYTIALKMIDVTVAFAMGSLTFVAVAVLSRILLREKISIPRAMGLLLILSGVALLGGQA